MNDLEITIKYVVEAHAGQLRKGNSLPYVVHPIDVMKRLSNWGIKDIVMLKAALCHDVLEERPDISFNALENAIGKQAAEIVQELTFIPNSESNLPTSVQKNNYISSVGQKSPQALVIKVADRICNTLDFMHDGNDYFHKYWAKADSLFKAFQNRKLELSDLFGNRVFVNIENELVIFGHKR